MNLLILDYLPIINSDAEPTCCLLIMSKRPLKPLGLGGSANKLPKLEVTISEHNFPLSQNLHQRSAPHGLKAIDEFRNIQEQYFIHNYIQIQLTDAALADEWGDVDDDLLLQASQACEQVDQHNQSTLPDYTAWMLPPSTSTQLQTQTNPFSYGQNAPSTSKATVTGSHQQCGISYKKADAPLSNIQNNVSNSVQKETFQFKKPSGGLISGIKDKCNRAPLAGISGSIGDDEMSDLFVLDNLKEDSKQIYRKLVQIQEENAKLKSENSKLLEQALSKDGEVTILRGRLRSSAVMADGARLERLRDTERLQAEWAERLQAASKQLGSLRTQLDCKELEVVRVKERCQLLESNKVKLSQTMPPPSNHRSQLSQRPNSFSIQREMKAAAASPGRRAVASAPTQTPRSAFLPLSTVRRSPVSPLSAALPLLLEPAAERERGAAPLAALHGELAALAAPACGDAETARRGRRVMSVVHASLAEVLRSLQAVKATATERRERDERRLREPPACARVASERLLAAGAIFRGERELEARRGVAALAALCARAPSSDTRAPLAPAPDAALVALMEDVAERVGDMSYGVQYSGLLLSFLRVAEALPRDAAPPLLRGVLRARPAAAALHAALPALRGLSASALERFCTDSAAGNLKFDYDQGLVLFKKESCFLQVLLHQLEACLKCTVREGRAGDVVSLAQGLVALYRNADALGVRWSHFTADSKCKCSRRLAQVLVYTLEACARMLKDGIIEQAKESSPREELLAACRCGVAALYLWTLRDVELRPLLAHYEGTHRAFLDLCDGMRTQLVTHDIHGNVLTELVAQPSAEDTESPAASLQDVWTDSFSHFHITD